MDNDEFLVFYKWAISLYTNIIKINESLLIA